MTLAKIVGKAKMYPCAPVLPLPSRVVVAKPRRVGLGDSLPGEGQDVGDPRLRQQLAISGEHHVALQREGRQGRLVNRKPTAPGFFYGQRGPYWGIVAVRCDGQDSDVEP